MTTNTFSHLVWLGAGKAIEPTGLLHTANNITLIEAREAACELLQQQYPQARVLHQLLASESTSTEFHHYNLAEFSAMQAATGLTALFPGLYISHTELLKTRAISETIASLNLQAGNNQLVVDITDTNLALLHALEQAGLLHLFSNILLQAGNTALYQGAATQVELGEFLQQRGYYLAGTTGSDPDLPWQYFELSPLWAQLQHEKEQTGKLTTELGQKNQALTTAQKTLADTQQQAIEQHQQLSQQLIAAKSERSVLAQRLDDTEAAFNDLNQKHNELKKILTIAQKSLADAQQQAAEQLNQKINEKTHESDSHIQQLTAELNEKKSALANAQQLQAVQETLEKTLHSLFANQMQEINKTSGNIKNHINSSLGNTAKQLEAFIGIQNYLAKGIKPLSFHGWPISPDIGLYLVGLIDQHHYDAIIEFGSGTSTVLMAKTLKTKLKKQKKEKQKAVAASKPEDSQPTAAIQAPNGTRIITFEHNIDYHTKTLQALKSNGVKKLVDLVHAPLVEFQYKDEGQYLYYSCSEKLQQLAASLNGKKANILVLVDGPPGATNKHARFPALPHLLNALPGHSLTILMDDYNRTEEKEIVSLWKNLYESLSINFEIEEIPYEKGLAKLTTNK